MLINRQKNLDALCLDLRAANAPVAIDTEFISERRYTPKLCLVQVFAYAGDRHIEALIDPFAVDLQPLMALIADTKVTKVVHAGGQDLAIFQQLFNCRVHHIFDTQIAAAFLGYGHQVGYADLVRRLLGGPQLSKEMQFTDWAARPLSPAQMEYALTDVRFLPQLYELLRRDLVARGRLQWAKTEFRKAEKKASESLPDDELYRKFNLAGLSRRKLAVLREIVAAREGMARAVDKPPTFIIPDAVVLQMAKHPPETPAELRSLRGIPNLNGEQVRKLLEAMQRAEALPNEALPERLMNERPDPRLEAVVSMLNVVTQARAVEHDISRTYLASRDQLGALAAWWLSGETTEPELPLLDDWRRELLGAELLDLLWGRVALTLDGGAARQSPDSPVVRTLRLDRGAKGTP